MKVRIALDIEINDLRVVQYLRDVVRNDMQILGDEEPNSLPDVLVNCLVSAIAPERPDDSEPIADNIYYAFFEENWFPASVAVEKADATADELWGSE